MYFVLRSTSIACVFACLFLASSMSTTLFAQSASSDRATSLQSVQNESNLLRKDLIDTYKTNPLFGELISKNAKINGAARRLSQQIENEASTDWQTESMKLDLLVFELETLIEEANFRGQINESIIVAKRLGNLLATIESIKSNSLIGVVETSDPGKLVDQTLPDQIQPDLLGTEFDPLAPLENATKLESATSINGGTDIYSPLIMDGQSELLLSGQPKSVLETGQRVDAAAPQLSFSSEETQLLQVPDLTAPTPELTGFDFNTRGGNALLPPNVELQPQRALRPALQAPQPLGFDYADPNASRRSRLLAVPIQFEFFSFNPGGYFGYQPYGGYTGRGGFHGHGGYRSFHSGGGGNCRSGW